LQADHANNFNMNLASISKYFFNQKGNRLVLIILLVTFDGLFGLVGISLLMSVLLPNFADGQIIESFLFYIEKMIELFGGNKIAFLVGVFTFRLFFSILVNYFTAKYSVKIMVSKRLSLVERVLESDLLSFQKFDAGTLLNIVSNETDKLRLCYGLLATLIQNITLSILFLSLSFLSNSSATIIVLVLGGIAAFAFKKINSTTKKLSIKVVSANNSSQNFIYQTVEGRVYLQAIHSYLPIIKKVSEQVNKVYLNMFKMEFISKIIKKSPEPIAAIFITISTLFYKNFGFSSPVELVTVLVFIYKSFISVINSLHTGQRLMMYSGSISSISHLEEELVQEEKGGSSLDSIPNINLSGLSKKYSEYLFKEMNQTFYPGRMYSISMTSSDFSITAFR